MLTHELNFTIEAVTSIRVVFWYSALLCSVETYNANLCVGTLFP